MRNALCLVRRIHGHAGPGPSGHWRMCQRNAPQILCGRCRLDGRHHRLGAGRTVRRPCGAGLRQPRRAPQSRHYAGLGRHQRELFAGSLLLVGATARRHERRGDHDSAFRPALEAHARSRCQAGRLLHQRRGAQSSQRTSSAKSSAPWCWSLWPAQSFRTASP